MGQKEKSQTFEGHTFGDVKGETGKKPPPSNLNRVMVCDLY